MKLTVTQLRRIIKEEASRVLLNEFKVDTNFAKARLTSVITGVQKALQDVDVTDMDELKDRLGSVDGVEMVNDRPMVDLLALVSPDNARPGM